MEDFCMLEEWQNYQDKKAEIRKFRSKTVMFIVMALQNGDSFYEYPNLKNNPGTLQYLKLYDDLWEIILHVEQEAQKAYWHFTSYSERLEHLMQRYYSMIVPIKRLCEDYLDLTTEMIEDSLKFFDIRKPQELYDILCFTNPWTLVGEKIDCQGDGGLYREFRVYVRQPPDTIAPDSEDEINGLLASQTISTPAESGTAESRESETELAEREAALGQSSSETEGNSYVGKVMIMEQEAELISPKLRSWADSMFTCSVVINGKVTLALFDTGAELSSIPLNLIDESQVLSRTVNVNSYLNNTVEMTLANIAVMFQGITVNLTALISPIHGDRMLLGRDFMFGLKNKMEEKGFIQPLFFLAGMGTMLKNGAGKENSSEIGMHPVQTRSQSKQLVTTTDNAHSLGEAHESNQSSDPTQSEGVVSQEMETNPAEKVILRTNGKAGQQRPITEIYFPSTPPDRCVLQPRDGAATSQIDMQPSVPVDDEILSSSRQKFKNELQNDLTLNTCRKQATLQPAEPKQKGDAIFVWENGLLYRKFISKETNLVSSQLCIPLSYRHMILQRAHESGNHLGINRTKATITKNFYWPNLHQDVTQYCNCCQTCQKVGYPRDHQKVPLSAPELFTVPFHKVAIDILGPFQASATAPKKYVLTCIDLATRYAQAKLLQSITATNVAKNLLQMWMFTGIPKTLLSDQGSSFVSKVMKELLKVAGVKHVTCLPYTHHSNGLVERLHATLNKMIRAYVLDRSRDWPSALQFFISAYNSTTQASTGFSPNFLLFGKEIRGIMDILRFEFEGETEDKPVTVDRYLRNLNDVLTRVRDLAKENLKTAHLTQKRDYDLHAKHRSLEVGDLALVLKPITEGKLAVKWAGPYKVKKKVNQTNYTLEIEGIEKDFHINLLKKYHTVDNVVSCEFLCLTDYQDTDDPFEPVWKLDDRELYILSLSDMDTWKWIIEPLGEDPETCADGRDDIDWDPDG